MKTILVTTALAMISFGTLAQGTVNFATAGASFNGAVNAPLTNYITGQKVSGTDFRAQLFYNDPASVADDAIDPRTGDPLLTAVLGGGLDPVGSGIAYFLTGLQAGYITTASGGGTRVLPGIAGGDDATVQIRAWSTSLGSDWNTALNTWLGGGTGGLIAQTKVFTIPAGNPPLVVPSALTGANDGWFPVPEPSTVALGVLGGFSTLLLLLRRGKKA